jgi:hypothetical protein
MQPVVRVKVESHPAPCLLRRQDFAAVCMGRLWKETGIHHLERKARIEPSVAANDVRLIARVRISGPCLAPTSRHHVCGLRGGLPLRRVFLALVLKADVRADYSC